MGEPAALRGLVDAFGAFSRACYPTRALRGYQLEAGAAVLRSIERGRGGSTVVIFSRQAGKDELLAQLGAYLLARFRVRGGGVVVAAPTYKPQCLISRRRLIERAVTPFHAGCRTSDGYRVACGAAGVSFLSTEASASVRGETSDVLLVGNEAQDIATDVWDARFAPMAASTNAPSLYCGTPWGSDSLLARERQAAGVEGALYSADWRRVAEEVPAYGDHVRARIARLGEGHPFIRTEYYLEELGSEGGLLPERRRAQMRGEHDRRHSADGGKEYALLLDVAGEEEDAGQGPARTSRRDSTALTVVEVDRSSVRDPLVALPTYRVVDRREWVGAKHTSLFASLRDLALDVWRARWLVVDATGIGAGLAAFLTAGLRGSRCEVLPVVFSARVKSDLGWGYVAAVESGRYKEYRDDGAVDTRRFWQQVAAVEYAVDDGPGRLMHWGVAASRGHDDLVLSAALVGILDGLDWRVREAVGRNRADWGVVA